jgi:hypothetical protein
MCLDALIRLHWGDFLTRVQPLAEPPPLIGLASACGATSTSALVTARVAVRHPAPGSSVMAPSRQAHDQGNPSNRGECARPVGRESAWAYTSPLSSPHGGPAVCAPS